MEQILPQNNTANTLILDLWVLSCEKINLLFKATQVVVICYGSLGKQVQRVCENPWETTAQAKTLKRRDGEV